MKGTLNGEKLLEMECIKWHDNMTISVSDINAIPDLTNSSSWQSGFRNRCILRAFTFILNCEILGNFTACQKQI